MAKNESNTMAQTSEMMHQALEILLTQAAQTDGQLGVVSLAVRYDARVGNHVHASATVRHRLSVTVDRSPKTNSIPDHGVGAND